MQRDIVIIPAGTNLGSYSQGAELGPEVLLAAGLQGILTSSEVTARLLEWSVPRDSGGVEYPGAKNSRVLIPWLQALRSTMQAIGPREIALTLGGDHAVGAASLLATKQRYPDAVCIYIDAHPDCQAIATSPTGNLHGMPVRIACGEELSEVFEGPYWQPQDFFMLGIKDIDPAEADWIVQHDVPNAHMDDVIGRGIGVILDQLSTWIGDRPVHISYDIDAIDVQYAPGTGIRNQGGLTAREATYIARLLGQQNVVAIDLVEFNPIRDKVHRTRDLALELIAHMLQVRWDGYTRYLHTSH